MAEAAHESPSQSDEADPRRAKARLERPLTEAASLAEGENSEIVLRYLLEAETFQALQDHPLLGGASRLRWSRQSREYFDTEFGDLTRRGLGLSLRRARGKVRMALEYGGGPGVPFARGEIEASSPDMSPRPELFAPDVARLIVEASRGRPPRACFKIEFRRASRTATREEATFEIVFTAGQIVAGPARETIFEIEIALKSGAPAALYRFGLALAEAGLTRIGLESRFTRGFRLASGTPAALARAAPPDFGSGASLDEATSALLRNGLQQFLGNWPAMQGGQISEAVHQIRVSLRRLRSALGLLRTKFACPEIDALRLQAKSIADAFGDARDWDVFARMVEAGPRAALPEVAGLSALVAQASTRTVQGRMRAAQTLASVATARFVLSLQLFIVTRGWRNAIPEDHIQALAEPAIDFASHALDRLHRRVRKRGRGFGALSTDPRHRLRIALKQLRYACEFLGPLYRSPARVRCFAKAAAELQDILGLANDSDVAASRIASLDLSSDPALGFAAGAVVGWCGRGARVDARVTRKAWRAFRKTASFWRDDEGRPLAEGEAASDGSDG